MQADPEKQTSPRERLAAIIARQDAERGRPLTAKEKLENLARSLGKPDDYFTRRKFDEPE